MKQIALLIPTYKHPETMEYVLEHQMPVFTSLGIDVYIYDSSPDKLTYYIVEKYMHTYGTALQYIHIPSTMQVERKMLTMMAGYGLAEDYEYVWPCKDRELFDYNDLCWVKSTLFSEHPDLLVMIPSGYYPTLGKKTINGLSPELLFREYSNALTSIDASIYRRDSILVHLKIPQRDFVKRDHLLGFPHYKVMLEELDKMEAPTITVLRGVDWNEYPTPSTWEESTFRIWLDEFVDLQNNLPNRYQKYKEEVTKREIDYAPVLGGYRRLTRLKAAETLTEEKFGKYEQLWPKVSSMPLSQVKKVMQHDLCSIYGCDTGSQVLNYLVYLHKGLSDNTLSSNDVNWDEISRLLSSYIYEKNSHSYYDEWISDYKKGVVDDLLQRINDDEETDSDSIKKLIEEIVITAL